MATSPDPEPETEAPDRSKWVSRWDDVVMSQCFSCKHLATANSGPVLACAAFPAAIPQPIFLNQADHRRPYEGDQGIHFEPKADVPSGVLQTLHHALDQI